MADQRLVAPLDCAACTLIPEKNIFDPEPVLCFRPDNRYQRCVEYSFARGALRYEPGGRVSAEQKDGETTADCR